MPRRPAPACAPGGPAAGGGPSPPGECPAPPPRFVCLEVGCVFSSAFKSSLYTHARTHSDERPFLCTIPGCGAAFKQSSILWRHKKQHLLQHDRLLYPVRRAALPCNLAGCDYIAACPTNLRRHKRAIHDRASGALTCKACGFTAEARSVLLAHVQQHRARTLRAKQRPSVVVQTAEGSLLAGSAESSALSQLL